MLALANSLVCLLGLVRLTGAQGFSRPGCTMLETLCRLVLLLLLLLLQLGVIRVLGIPRPVLLAFLIGSISLMVGWFFFFIVNLFTVIKIFSFLCLSFFWWRRLQSSILARTRAANM